MENWDYLVEEEMKNIEDCMERCDFDYIEAMCNDEQIETYVKRCKNDMLSKIWNIKRYSPRLYSEIEKQITTDIILESLKTPERTCIFIYFNNKLNENEKEQAKKYLEEIKLKYGHIIRIKNILKCIEESFII